LRNTLSCASVQEQQRSSSTTKHSSMSAESAHGGSCLFCLSHVVQTSTGRVHTKHASMDRLSCGEHPRPSDTANQSRHVAVLRKFPTQECHSPPRHAMQSSESRTTPKSHSLQLHAGQTFWSHIMSHTWWSQRVLQPLVWGSPVQLAAGPAAPWTGAHQGARHTTGASTHSSGLSHACHMLVTCLTHA
jgi:hypothetical protein